MISLAILVSPEVALCNPGDSLPKQVNAEKLRSPAILSSGFIDVITNGQVSASARLLRVFIGEPGRFSIPLSIYSGVSSGNFSTQPQNPSVRSNEQLFTGFINPLSGIINASIEGKPAFRHQNKTTLAGFIYQVGIRVLTGYSTGPPTSPSTGRPINFLNNYVAGGFYFQTGAWEKSEPHNLGSFWMTFRYIASYSTTRSLRPIQPEISSGFYYGWSLGSGIEINELIDFKIIYYKYIREPQISYNFPICQFSFHYALNSR